MTDHNVEKPKGHNNAFRSQGNGVAVFEHDWVTPAECVSNFIQTKKNRTLLCGSF